MELFDNLALGFGVAFTFQNLIYAFIGCLLGTLIGVLPGVGPVATIAMLLPATYALPPVAALIMLAGIYYGAQYGGSTTAILVNLPGEASSVVTQAANYAKSGRPTRILVVGHADTSGSAAYNVGLSNRRSRTVADALVAQGVNGGVISLDGKGETALARATADGVREPLNRRSEVTIIVQ